MSKVNIVISELKNPHTKQKMRHLMRRKETTLIKKKRRAMADYDAGYYMPKGEKAIRHYEYRTVYGKYVDVFDRGKAYTAYSPYWGILNPYTKKVCGEYGYAYRLIPRGRVKQPDRVEKVCIGRTIVKVPTHLKRISYGEKKYRKIGNSQFRQSLKHMEHLPQRAEYRRMYDLKWMYW